MIRARRTGLRVAAAGAAVALTALLAETPASGAFTAQTGTGGSTVTAAASFCVSPGPQDLAVTNDSWTDQGAPDTAHGTTAALEVQSAPGANHRTYLRFTLPSAPHDCELVSAQLRLKVSASTAGRTIAVQRADPTQSPQWTAGGLTWNNQPAPVGSTATSAAPAAGVVQTWDVTAQTTVLMTGPNNGLVVKDATEGQTGPFTQKYDEQSTAGGSPAVLRLTWG
jgi:hypothetical protein